MYLNKETKNKIKRIIVATGGVLIILIFFIVFVFSNNSKNKEITSSSDFKNIKQALEFFECEYYGTNNGEIQLSFKVNLYDDKVIYENYYNNLISAVSNVVNYNSFKMSDTKKNIYIYVKCNNSNKTIERILINDEENFFQNIKSKVNLESFTSVNNISVNIQSNILTSLIRSDWEYNANLFGTRDTVFDNYDIYFGEGLRVRNVSNKVFNIIFTKNYDSSIINDIVVGDSFEKIENILGKPTFEDASFIGYKTDKFYIFFLENQISIYRVEEYDTNEFAKIISKFVNQKNSADLVNEITKIWPDFDYILNDSGVVNVLYTLKGVNIQFNYVLKHGVHIYNNFKGNITENINVESLINNQKELPSNIFIESEDLVYKAELKRAHSYNNIDYFYPQFKILVQDVERIIDNGGNVEDSLKSSADNRKVYLL